MSLKTRLPHSPEFQAFVTKVMAAISGITPERSGAVEALQNEQDRLQLECDGYLVSLGKMTLPASLREVLEPKSAALLDRIREIKGELEELAHFEQTKATAVNPDEVADVLSNLAAVLDGQNAAAMNVMLAQHIDRIDCFPDRKVQMRTCQLGAMATAKDLLSRYAGDIPNPDADEQHIEPRRLGRRDVGMGIEDEEEAEAANNFAVDPKRFGDLPAEWFSVDEFQEPEYHSWVAANAKIVAEYRLANRATVKATAEHFDKSIPTIRSTLRIASEQHGIDALGKLVSRTARVTWPMANAQRVVEFLNQPGHLLKDAVKYFGKSEPTVRLARDIGLRNGPSGRP